VKQAKLAGRLRRHHDALADCMTRARDCYASEATDWFELHRVYVEGQFMLANERLAMMLDLIRQEMERTAPPPATDETRVPPF
jgi:hypothetical protein